MSIGWELYLNALKWGKSRQDELSYLHARLSQTKNELNALKGKASYVKPHPPGWIFERCKCGFGIITMADGKHYCPKCSGNLRHHY